MMNYLTCAPISALRNLFLLAAMAAISLACGGGGSSSSSPPPSPAADISISGVVSDGPVFGGTIFVFDATQVIAALGSIDPNGDRLAALSAAASAATLTRDPASEDQYSVTVAGDLAGEAAFLIFDNTDAEDDQFKDTPPNLSSVVMLGDAGSTQRINLTLQTSLVADLVLRELDPDGDGTSIDAAAIQSAIDTATASTVAAFATDALGRETYAADFNPLDSDDDDLVHESSGAIGFLLRTASQATGLANEDVIAALAGDSADGVIDGGIPLELAPTPEEEAAAHAVAEIAAAGSNEEFEIFAEGPCSSSAVAMRQACDVDTVDDQFELTAICTDISDDDDRADCLAEVEVEKEENSEACEDVFFARLLLCADLDDAAHEPMFGGMFAGNFVDPLEIGNSVLVNPWYPLVTGNRWVYEGDGETIVVEVTDETKLIDGVTCVVVIDTASEDDIVVEVTRDWYAQDLDGNIWYCGEISRNFEVFEGDTPEEPELVDIDGSWKAGRDGAEAGMLLPFDPQIFSVIRQEVAYGEAEDVIEIVSLTATASSPGADCIGNCLVTTDFTPLEPDVEETKYYAPGVGLIAEVDAETGDRVELVEFTVSP